MLKSETAGSLKGITYESRSSGKLKSTRAGFIIVILLLSSCLSLVVGTNTVAAYQDGDYIYEVSAGSATITGYMGAGGDVTIPSTLGGYPVVAIGDYAFYDCTVLTSVTIGDGVTTIGSWAFAYCTALTSVTIPESVTTIGYAAFALSPNLASVAIGNGVTTIGDGAFLYCTALTSVTLPESVTTIGDYAFGGCWALTSVVIPDSVTTIGSGAFSECYALTSVTIGNGVTTIGSLAFAYCTALTSVTLPESVTTIGDYAFFDCTVLTSVTFYGLTAPTSVGAHWIDDTAPGIQGHAYAFSNFPAPGGYFYGLLMGAVIPCDYIFTVSAGSATITGYTGAGGDITIPSTLGGYPVVAIGNYAFLYCHALTSVTIPDSVTTIGDYAFHYCTALTSVTIGNGVTTIGLWAFAYCTALTSVTIGDGVTTIGDYAFYYCTALTSVTIGNGVTTIGDYAFRACWALTSVVIPDSVTTIGDYAFYYCIALTSVTIGNGVTTIGSWAFAYCIALTSVTIGDIVTTIGDNAFYYCHALTSVTIPESVTTIGYAAFADCTALASVVIPDSVTTIGDYAFFDCTALTSVTTGNGVTTIGSWAFANCTALTSVTFYGLTAPTSVGADWIDNTAPGIQGHAYAFSDFPAPGEYFYGLLMGAVIPCDYIFTVSGGVATITGYTGAGGDITIPSTLGGYPVVGIGDSAFFACTALTSVVIPDSVATIGDSAFLSCTALTSVTIPESVTTIGDYAFGKCWALTSVVIPDSVTTIGSFAFAHCTALTSVTIGKRVTTIGDSAFFDCTALTSVTFYGLTAPTSVGEHWVYNTAPGIQGHAYFASDFPGPGEYFFGLLMGGYVDGPQTAVISFSQNGVGVSAPDVVLTVDGSPYLSGQLPVSFTWSIGTHHVFSWSSEVYDGSGTRHQWLYSSGLSSAQSGTIIVLRDGSITAFYSTEYLVSFGQSGLGEDATGTVVAVDGLPLTYGDLPYSTWVGDSETIVYSHEAVVSSGTDTDYVLTSVIGPASPITVVGPVTVLGSYVLGETGPPKEKTGSYVFYPPSDGWWRAQVVNDGLRSIYLTVIDVEYLPGSEPDLAERVNFMKLDCYPVGTAYSSSVYMLAGHGYNISVTPYGDGSVQMTDEFTPDTEASSLSVSLLGVVGASSGVLLFAMVCLGPYLLTRVGKMSSRELPVPGAARRTSVKKVRALRGMTDRDRSS